MAKFFIAHVLGNQFPRLEGYEDASLSIVEENIEGTTQESIVFIGNRCVANKIAYEFNERVKLLKYELSEDYTKVSLQRILESWGITDAI